MLSSQKSSQGTQKQHFYSLQSSSQANSQGQASSSQDNKSDDEENENDDEKISFYLKVEKYKKFKFMWLFFYFRKKQKMNHENTNRINNYIYWYCIKDTKENFNKIEEVITQREINTRRVEEKIGHAYFVGNPFLTIKFTMVLNHSCHEQFPWDRPWKLKHLTFSSVSYKLLNTSYIFTYTRWKYCRCNKFQGCRLKPINGIIADKNYCYVCHLGVTYNEEKIRNIKKILLIHNNFLEIK